MLMAKASPIFEQLNIVCGDVAASLAFYRRLGLEIPESDVWSTKTGIHHVSAQHEAQDDAATLDLDSTAFAQHWNQGWKGRADLAGRVVVGFGVATRDAVDRLYAEMTDAGYKGLQAPFDAFWGARYAIIEDPDGLAVGLMSPVAEEYRSPPPDV
jgi:catechol 2,3-dioxygenase-like lactoylglutathione lyase family enzyme